MNQFDAAKEIVKNFRIEPNETISLELYALAMQSMYGDNCTWMPIFGKKSRQKWQHWLNFKGMAKEVARKNYIQKVNEIRFSYD